ncbi:MAG: nascent polypeptide-associated complex protein [Thaumarchaeota archaeon]|nr:nascent polypeptide-associated complex protein [Candidatus Calditenuaceae archaeon]MDW8042944.1 nascent polypeptide-associated complex protein [Nitrososphaerota archaeon]
MKRVSPRALRRMQERLLSSSGISMNELGEARVLIELGERRIRLEGVTVVELEGPMGKVYQLVGGREVEEVAVSEEVQATAASVPEVSDEDVALVAAQAGVSEEEARRALIEAGGDLARAILSLRSRK